MKQTFRNHLLQTCSEEELKRWFDPLEFEFSEAKKEVVVVFPHPFFSKWFEDTIQGKFEVQLGQFLGNGNTVRYRSNGAQTVSPAVEATRPTKRIDFPFDAQFSFDTFLVNRKNYFPLASAKEVAKQGGSLYNPFIICGTNGSGKTHLMKSVANELSKTVEVGRIFFGSMDEVHNLYTIRYGGDTFRARNHLFDYDYLFIDDFHQIRNYPSMQREIINLFNHFYDNKKQMVFTCRDKVASYDFLDPTLQSRLGWGLIVTVKEPDMEIRANYIRNQCQAKNLPLTKEQILTLAQRFTDFRYLQGILLKLFAFRELVKKDLSRKDFEHILTNTEEKATDELQPGDIMTVVSDHFNVTVREITGSKRHQNIAQARQVAMFLCRNLLDVSYPALGKVFGGKDHSTVLYSVKKVQKMQKDNNEMKQLLKTLKTKCHSSGSS